MLSSCGCTNITPYPKSEYKEEFWSQSKDPTIDKANLKMLYEFRYLPLEPRDSKSLENTENSENLEESTFWNSFRNALIVNKRGQDRKTRILSIIADQFTYKQLRKNFSPNAIELARKYSRLYGPGAPQVECPKKSVQRMDEIKEIQFLSFFQDKNNVVQSSYQVDAKADVSILYMQDQKEALWTKFN
ncbi:hypothetical protein C2G38_2151581 [Gigaspora rosea]|uniref:Uncharacterized protein n=1 Tax=Gigaspora rosea TaxID=44941 RepID=A0A397WAY9_9GLOM|nr:hypothetical protein C2G38_2151581 [Gigaspora rosea]